MRSVPRRLCVGCASPCVAFAAVRGTALAMNRLRLEHEVGKGAYGIVYLGYWRAAAGAQERKVAVKCIKRDFSSKGVPHNACREIGMLKELRHANVVELLEVVVNVKDMELNVVLDWADFDLRCV